MDCCDFFAGTTSLEHQKIETKKDFGGFSPWKVLEIERRKFHCVGRTLPAERQLRYVAREFGLDPAKIVSEEHFLPKGNFEKISARSRE